MAQAWHGQTVEGLGQAEKAWYRRASAYELAKDGTPVGPRAITGATWTRFDPFTTYKRTVETRDKDAGPHLDFLNMRALMGDKPAFENKHGLLGLFYDEYSAPILPVGKVFVLPEAVVYKSGELRLVDPATKGREYLQDVLRDQWLDHEDFLREEWPEYDWDSRRTDLEGIVCLPSDVKFAPKRLVGSGRPDPGGRDLHSDLVPWVEARKGYGALMVMDGFTSTRSSILCTSEPYFSWWTAIKDFPSGPFSNTDKELAEALNSELADVSPYAFEGENREYEPGWRCSSLLRAMYTMLYIDVYVGRDISKCKSKGCPAPYFRMGPQSKSIYCSKKCANRASTRIGRGQEP
jgi:hypothetical protein